jgi:hypothetical protein
MFRMKGIVKMKSCVLVFAGLHIVLLAGCLSPSSPLGTDPGFRQHASIRVTKVPDGYYVEAKVDEAKSSSLASGQHDTLSAPGITVPPNEWSEIRVCTTNNVCFDAEVVLGKDTVKISHPAGVLLRVIIRPTKQEDIVHARGILSIAGEGGDPSVGHRVLPFDLECKIGKQTVFFQKSCTPKEETHNQ